MIIAIIGGGASGMAAALAASENNNAKIILLEKQARVGKKLQATGNGRCNLSNLHALEYGFHGDSPEFCRYALEHFSPQETIKWFQSLGLFTVSESSGRVYPYSDQANSVLDILRFALMKRNIELRTEWEVIRAKKRNAGFIIENGKEQIQCDKLIIACGGLAGTKLGGSLSGYKLLQSFGHTCSKLRPSLVQIKADWKGINALKGIRANCRATICCNDQKTASSEGEIQFTEYGLSGPVIFEISRDVCSHKGEWIAEMDLLPQTDEDALRQELNRRKSTALTTDDLLTGILHNRLGRVLTKMAEIPFGISIHQVEEQKINKLCKLVKSFKIPLKEPMGMDHAQVTAGGIHTKDFIDSTMESSLIKGLFACGEVLDIDGDCGGFNLQWAWSSGRLAGQNAAEIK